MNNNQRQALDKIANRAINDKRNDLYDLKETLTEKREQEIKKTNYPKAKKIYTAINDFEQKISEAKKQLSKLSYGLNYSDKLTVSLTREETKNIEKIIADKKRLLDKTETKLLAKVWGVESSFDDIMKVIEKELASI